MTQRNQASIGTGNQGLYGWLNKINDPSTRQAVKQMMDELTTIKLQMQQMGTLTRPLTQALNASNLQLKKLQDPSDPQDAVTLKFLQQYVANFASAFSGAEAGAGGGEGGSGGDGVITPVPNHGDIVSSVWATFVPPLSAADPNSRLFEYAQKCAWAIMLAALDPVGVDVGLLLQPSGDGVFTCSGETFATFRICYNNGANIKILTGGYMPQWTQEGDVPLDVYHVPTDPAIPCT